MGKRRHAQARTFPALTWALPAALALLAFFSFWPALSGDFVNWDDATNFVENPSYRGFGAQQLLWMFTTHNGHYIPLTWLTLALDFRLWGMNPFGYHLTNLLLHAGNAVLLYHVALALLQAAFANRHASAPTEIRMRWAAATATALHTLHPLRVESVAWITERRDVLCGIFFLSAIAAYLAMQRQPAGTARTRWWVLSVGFFAASLLSKVLGVTLPLVLLVLDVYPLRRLGSTSRTAIIKEKLPHFALAVAAIAGGLAAEKSAGALALSDAYTIWHRLLQPGHRLCFYLGKILWPADLSPLYMAWPVPLGTEPRFVVGTLAALAVSLGLWAARKRWPAGLAAWLVFVTLLAPTLGVIQIGAQYAADRFTYLAAIPWAIVIAGGLCTITDVRKTVGAAAVLLATIGLAVVLTFRQAQIWKNSLTLWDHALALDQSLFLGYNNRGLARRQAHDLPGALADYDQALALDPQHLSSRMNRGIARADVGDLDGSIDDFRFALRLAPRADVAHDLAAVLAARATHRLDRQDTTGAVTDLREALRALPPAAPAREGLHRQLAAAQARATTVAPTR